MTYRRTLNDATACALAGFPTAGGRERGRSATRALGRSRQARTVQAFVDHDSQPADHRQPGFYVVEEGEAPPMEIGAIPKAAVAEPGQYAGPRVEVHKRSQGKGTSAR